MNDTLSISVLSAAAVAGALYVLTPGPAVLALLGIGADRGRRAAAAFLIGHLAGDVLWTVLALVAMIGAEVLDPLAFDLLALACGGYLFRLGWRAVCRRQTADGTPGLAIGNPLRTGVLFGVTNPKSYPVALAMFTALLAGRSEALGWASGPPLLAAAFGGFLVADAILIWLVGLGPLRRLYRRRQLWIVRTTGALFLGFAVHAVAGAGPAVVARLFG